MVASPEPEYPQKGRKHVLPGLWSLQPACITSQQVGDSVRFTSARRTHQRHRVNTGPFQQLAYGAGQSAS